MHAIVRLMAVATLAALATTAQGACTALTLKGVWGFSYDTFRLQDNGYCAGIGLMTFTPATSLGSDSVKVSAQRESCNGTPVVIGSARGNYSVVTASCTANSTNLVYSPSGKSAKLDMNIVAGGTKLQFVMVINGVTLHGEAVKR